MPQMGERQNQEMPQMGGFDPTQQSEPFAGGMPSGEGSISLAKGQTFEIVDASGNVVYSGTATRNADYVFYSSEDLEEGATYTLKVAGESVATATVGASSQNSGNFGFPGGQSGQNPTPATTESPSSQGSGNFSKGSGTPSVTPSDSKTNYRDVKSGEWYEDAVEYVTKHNLMNGVGEGLFAPDRTTTRGMFLTSLYRLKGSPAVKGKPSFADVADTAYYADAIAWGAENGIVNGISDTSFAPDAIITREQMATMLMRYRDYQGEVVPDSGETEYGDASDISDYAKGAVSYAKEKGLLKGDANGHFRPKEGSSRAELATVLMRLAQK